jgi:hypothetical protein
MGEPRTNTEVIRTFVDALRQARELEVGKLWFPPDQLEFFRSEMARAHNNLCAIMSAYNTAMTTNAAHIETVLPELKELPCWECRHPRADEVRGLLDATIAQYDGDIRQLAAALNELTRVLHLLNKAALLAVRGAPIVLLEPGPYWEGWTEAEKAERFASALEETRP